MGHYRSEMGYDAEDKEREQYEQDVRTGLRAMLEEDDGLFEVLLGIVKDRFTSGFRNRVRDRGEKIRREKSGPTF